MGGRGTGERERRGRERGRERGEKGEEEREGGRGKGEGVRRREGEEVMTDRPWTSLYSSQLVTGMHF